MPNLNPKIFHEKIFYYESVLENPNEIIDLIEQTNNILTENDAISP